MSNAAVRIHRNDGAAHLYELEVSKEGEAKRHVLVDAGSRNEAHRIAERLGYTVNSVNMLG